MPATATKIDSTCHSPLLFIGEVLLRPSAPKALEQFPDAEYELGVDIIGPPGYRVVLDNLMLFLTITDPPLNADGTGVFFVQHADTGWYWGLPVSDTTPPGLDGWVEDLHQPHQPTRRLRGRKEHDAIWSGPGNGSTYWIGVNGLKDTQPLSFTAYPMAEKAVATTSGCTIQLTGLSINEELTGTWGG
ncbi:hypothetical protein [Streptomyces sp. 1331.2]|uniref:hypothetical protein n=1 Tax=Streptomyces sp. 1331.2 TaxID=1938835 RepID=UPI000BC7C836|nr:hypothetical protein [Streptomyces sp. 1331.2]SOB81708.1 hypothetical protein SAMN06272789_1847 [Streptomyces sp. 1331.2]